jgi:subtilisin family serine protease
VYEGVSDLGDTTMKQHHLSKRCTLELLDTRLLLAWNSYADLIDQDAAARNYSQFQGQGQTVAVIDTGIDYTHPSLGGTYGQANSKVIAGYDFVDNDADPMDTDGHGTNVAGMIAANRYTQNGLDYQGVAPQAKLVGLRISDDGESIDDRTIEDALQWVIDNAKRYNITSVNLSLGSGSYNDVETSDIMSDEFETLRKMNVYVTAASGNSGDSFFGGTGVAYPAADPNVMAVGSVKSDGTLSSFTQRNSLTDLVAPGEDVLSTKRGGGYELIDGTSFASPVVAGLAAIIRQVSPATSVDDVASIMQQSSMTVRDDGDTDMAFGLININRAIIRTLSLTRNTISNLPGSSTTTLDTHLDRYGTMSAVFFDADQQKLMTSTQLSNGRWSRPTVVDSTTTSDRNFELTIDTTGKPQVAYRDATNGDLRLATFNGRAFEFQTIDTAGDVGLNPSIGFDRGGNTRLSYYDQTNGDLKLATQDARTRQWSLRVLDSQGDVGRGAKLAMGEDGRGNEIIAVAYQDTTNGDLKYTRMFSGDPFQTFVVDNLTGVDNINLTLENGRVVIVYRDVTKQDVKYAYRDTNWFTETVASKGNVGTTTSIFYDGDNRLTIAYYDATQRSTFLARRSNNGTWSSTKLMSGGQNFALADSPSVEIEPVVLAADNQKKSFIQAVIES